MTDKCAQETITLRELLKIINKYKIQICLITIALFLLAFIYCMVATPKYEIVAQVQAGIVGYNNNVPIRDINPDIIISLFSKKDSIDFLPSQIKNQSKTNLTQISAIRKRKSDIIMLKLLYPEPKEGKKVLQELIETISSILSESLKGRLNIAKQQIISQRRKLQLNLEKIFIQKTKIDGEIKQKYQELKTAKIQLEALYRDQEQTKKIKNSITKQIHNVDSNTNELLELRKKIITSDTDKLSTLIYTNIFQQNIAYLTSLEQRLAQIEKELNQYKVLEAETKEAIAKIETTIKELEAKRDRELPLTQKAIQSAIKTLDAMESAISPLEIVQPPMASNGPVSPPKKAILITSIIFGIILGVFLAFMREMIPKMSQRVRKHPENLL